MSEKEQARCPYCGELMTWLKKKNTSASHLYKNWELACKNPTCNEDIILLVTADTRSNCIRRANSLKLVDRLVRKAVDDEREACAVLVDDYYEGRIHGDLSKAIRAGKTKGKP